MNKLKVLSLFDGLSGAQIALNKLGVICEYYSSEIDNYAINITQKNFPNTIQLGDILQFFKFPKFVQTSPMMNLDKLPKDIDLLIGGSPCTDLSIAKNNGKGLDGEQSRLFWAYVRILDYYCETQTKHFYFVLENVASMKTKDFVIITNTLGVEPILLDAGLVSAQRRKRYFWTNIPGITQPKDKGLVIADILEDAPREVVKIAPERLIKTSYGVRWNGHQKTQNLGLQGCQAQNKDEKTPTLTANIGKGPTRIVSGSQSQKAVEINQKGFVIDAGLGAKYPYRIVKENRFRSQPQGRCAQEVMQKSFCITSGCVAKNHALIVTDYNSQQNRAFSDKEKYGALPASRTTSKTIFVFEDLTIEKLTWNEIEKLAGLPVGYTNLGEKKNRAEHRGRAIGNGFQIDILIWLLSFLLLFATPLNRQTKRLKAEQPTLF